MTQKLLIIPIFILGIIFNKAYGEDYIVKKGNVIYDFSFAELAVKYLETEDSFYLHKISELGAIEHILNHAKQFNYNVPTDSKLELAIHLLSPINEKKEILNAFKKNLTYAKKNIAALDIPQKTCLQYLPNSFQYESRLFFTFGYDLGVAHGKNASLNLAHPYYLENTDEIEYYSIHELHHAGFIILKKNIMPSLDISTYAEMSSLIEYLTHLEGMGTFAPLALRKKEHAMNTDKDYIALQDSLLMAEYEKEFFSIYFHFKNNPDSILTKSDWGKLSILSNKKRLWYRVGAKIADTIDRQLGREKLVALIAEPSENFLTTYLELKK